MIPKQLRNLKFCRVRKGTKKPFEKNWTNKHYSYKEISKFKNENYGIHCGINNLGVIDSDNESLQIAVENLLPKTYRVKTGGGGVHNYFSIPNLDQKLILETEDGTHLGEIQWKGQQVVGAGSIHPNGKKYEELNQEPIATISAELIYSNFKPFIKQLRETEENVKWERKEHSEIDDLSVASIWGTAGLKKHGSEYYGSHPIHGSDGGMNFWINPSKNMWHCFRCDSGGGVLSAIAVKEGIIDCSEAHKGYLRGSKAFEAIEKAKEKYGLKIMQTQQTAKTTEEKLEGLYTDKELLDYEPEPQEWLIENQIPKGEVGLLVGKRGERKTFLALYQALCLGSGKDCIEDKVPKMKSILIIDEETGINAMAKRIKILKKGLELENISLDINYISFSGLKLDRKDEKFKKFMNHIEEFKPDLIIVDCLQRSVTFEVDKDNAKISELFTEVVRPTIQKYKCSWLFIHHLRKSPPNKYNPEDLLDEVRGGSELVNYCRYILMCQTPRGQQQSEDGSEFMIFRVLKMSNSPIQEPKVVSFCSEDDKLTVSYAGLPEEVLAGEVRCANKIKEYLFEKQLFEFKTKEIVEAAEEIGFKKNLINNGLKVLLNKGILNKISRGKWGVVGESKEQKKIS